MNSDNSHEQFPNTAGSMKHEEYTYQLHLCKTSAVVQKLYDADLGAKLNFVNLHLRDGEIESTVLLFGGEAWFQTGGHMNKRFPMLMREVPLDDARLVCGVFQGTLD